MEEASVALLTGAGQAGAGAECGPDCGGAAAPSTAVSTILVTTLSALSIASQ